MFLDCLTYNAHTTAVDSLWGGLPVGDHGDDGDDERG